MTESPYSQSSWGDPHLVCSAKRCGADATHQVIWNNPKIHTPDRRKIWLACDEHAETLRKFLDARGFWIENVAIED